ncbi:ceramide-1-phosphate transfer protein isoform X1 [Amblyraja radiata]|uniref:ceramide-1-phosphate transfer protein isoform X1 n=2 Tax=Amblyraja radiata TaxID=386614 RepID=UPI001402DBDD|nr:ceramide-1-phosphate transfer protein isoform X1 [Amblyraja radiata]
MWYAPCDWPAAAGGKMAAAEAFRLSEVLESFRRCLTQSGELEQQHYLAGWKGLVKFMSSLGTAFSFISKDAVTKIQILENYQSGENGSQYKTIQSMVKYEVDNKLVDVKKRGDHWNSGCRTLLRLHRALRWLQLFLEKLRVASDDSNTSVLCAEAYNDSLANYHQWIVRKSAVLAFHFLPGRADFFEVMNMGTTEKVVETLGEAVPLISKAYDITQDLYAQHGLLDLP